jgi:syntaxin-binding protein 1
MSLTKLARQKVMDDVIRGTTALNKTPGKLEWRVLVVDMQSMRMLSACTKMHELCEEGITLLETIEKRREPVPVLEAIYLMTPNENTVKTLINDFQSKSRREYKAAHVYFTEPCPGNLFDLLSKSYAAKCIRTLKEINMSFLPIETQVYSLDKPLAFQILYNPELASQKTYEMERMAAQLATLCTILGEYPSIRYKGDNKSNYELAQMVSQKLDAYKEDDPTLGVGSKKAKSQLLILDRGFDTVSTLLHELTFQAMTYDLLGIQKDVFSYENSLGQMKEVLLDENDELWVEMRHQHIAEVSRNVTQKLKNFHQETDGIPDGMSNLRDLSQAIKKLPQHKKELSKICKAINLAEENMKKYQGSINKLYEVEQDLATGIDTVRERIGDYMNIIGPILLDPNVSITDKIRIILIYIQSQNGISEDTFTKVIQHAQIPKEKKDMITNMALLGKNIILHESKLSGFGKIMGNFFDPKKHHIELSNTIKRWTPVLKEIIESTIEETLDLKKFPIVCRERKHRFRDIANDMIKTTGYGNRHKDKTEEVIQQNVPRLIVFIMGGVTHSECRVAYEVMKENKNWEIIVGGSQILTPEGFLDNIKQLSAKEDDENEDDENDKDEDNDENVVVIK